MKSVQLREWQREALGLYLKQIERGERESLWEATPGAGKTTGALHLVKHQLKTRSAKTAMIVVPTSHLRNQWARAAARMGLHLDSNFGGSRKSLTSDFHGAVVTYQQFQNRKKLFQSLAKTSVVVLDEVHHSGDGLSWGLAIREALTEARYILCLSGTAFRSDNNPIPFVKYDKHGFSKPDFVYPYKRAVEERVCRPTAVFTYGGVVSWSENSRVLSASFGDRLDPATSARRLRAALDSEAGWILPMLREAHAMLLATRKEHPKAGALMVCADQRHARQMAKLLTVVSGEKPTVVLSDDSGASRKIKEYADGSGKWIVACNMVSEGVDIPRLRVGVYGTTIRTKMYFHQFLGRIVRRQASVPGLQVSYLYLPADPELHRLAEEIESECRHFLFKANQNPFDELDERRRPSQDKAAKAWTTLSAVNSGVDSVIVHGNQLALFSGMAETESVRKVVHREVELRFEESMTKSEQKAQLSSEIRRLVGLYHRKSNQPHSAIHATLNKTQRLRSQIHCTFEQLQERVILLEKLLGWGVPANAQVPNIQVKGRTGAGS